MTNRDRAVLKRLTAPEQYYGLSTALLGKISNEQMRGDIAHVKALIEAQDKEIRELKEKLVQIKE